MTTSDARKMLTQLEKKPWKIKRFEKYNLPRKRTTGKALHKCKRCGRMGGHISSYNLNLCRHCFREIATQIGFKKYR